MMLKIYGCRWIHALDEYVAFIFMAEYLYLIKLHGILTQKISILVNIPSSYLRRLLTERLMNGVVICNKTHICCGQEFGQKYRPNFP
jgi:hypothetical protein